MFKLTPELLKRLRSGANAKITYRILPRREGNGKTI